MTIRISLYDPVSETPCKLLFRMHEEKEVAIGYTVERVGMVEEGPVIHTGSSLSVLLESDNGRHFTACFRPDDKPVKHSRTSFPFWSADVRWGQTVRFLAHP